MPVASGRRCILAGSVPAMHAAASSGIPAAEPAVTRPASAPVNLAMTSPALPFSSCMSTYQREASSMAFTTDGGIRLPPRTVSQEPALITRLTPSLR